MYFYLFCVIPGRDNNEIWNIVDTRYNLLADKEEVLFSYVTVH